jgi:hypothetical protein
VHDGVSEDPGDFLHELEESTYETVGSDTGWAFWVLMALLVAVWTVVSVLYVQWLAS